MRQVNFRTVKLGMVARASTWEAETGGLMQV